jgi:FtsH-binding integral membrane protein
VALYPIAKAQSVTSVTDPRGRFWQPNHTAEEWAVMKKIFAIMAIAFALTTVMAATTVITYTDQSSACAPGQVC